MFLPGGDLLAAIEAGRTACERQDWAEVRVAAELMMLAVGQTEAARRVWSLWRARVSEVWVAGDGGGI